MLQHLDLIAMIPTGASTWLFAYGKERLAFVGLIGGSLLWVGVALVGSMDGRPIYGMLVSSLNTMLAAAMGVRRSLQARRLSANDGGAAAPQGYGRR